MGARLLYLITRPQLIDHSWWKFWEGGMVSFGGLAGALLSLWAYRRAEGLAAQPFFDTVAPCLLVGWAVGRFGCFFHWWGEEGLSSSLPWKVVVNGAGYHPHQLYLITLLLCTAGWVWRMGGVGSGRPAVSALGGFAFSRGVADCWRLYQPTYLKSLSQGFCLAVLLCCLFWYWRERFHDVSVEA